MKEGDLFFRSDLSHAECARVKMKCQHQVYAQLWQKRQKKQHWKNCQQHWTGACLDVTTPSTSAWLKHFHYLTQNGIKEATLSGNFRARARRANFFETTLSGSSKESAFRLWHLAGHVQKHTSPIAVHMKLFSTRWRANSNVLMQLIMQWIHEQEKQEGAMIDLLVVTIDQCFGVPRPFRIGGRHNFVVPPLDLQRPLSKPLGCHPQLDFNSSLTRCVFCASHLSVGCLVK